MSDDMSELYQLAADLESGGKAVSRNARKAVQVTSHKVKTAAQQSVRGRKGLGHAASAISYDTTESGDGVESEIGYDKDRPVGRLGNLIEYGAPNSGNQLSPSHDLGNALIANEQDFVDGIAKAADDALKEAGL